MSSSDALKKPLSVYFLWQNANREKIQKLAGAKDFKTVAAKTSELWKTASSLEKAPFEKEAQRQKEAYDAYTATEEGQNAVLEKKAGKQEQKQAKQEKEAEKAKKVEEKQIARDRRECKAAVKAVEKDDKLKKPLSSYFAWLNDNRARITALVGGKGGPEVTKKGSEMWKALPEKERAPYDAKAKKDKEEYDAYIATPEGAAALKAYKEAAGAVAYKEKVVDDALEGGSPKKATQKRKVDVTSDGAETDMKKKRSAKAGA